MDTLLTTQENNTGQPQQTERGPFPEEFLTNLSYSAFDALNKKLETHQVPPEVLQCFETLYSLEVHRRLERETFPAGGVECYDFELTDLVSRLTWGIVQIGGSFYGPD